MNKACTNADLYRSVRNCPGKFVAPGIRPYIYYINKEYIKEWPTLPEDIGTGDDMGVLATYSGNFTLEADKCWRRLDLKDLASNLTSETQGEPPSATHLNHLEAVVSGTSAAISGFARSAINDRLVFLVPDREKGKIRVVGCEDFDTITKVGEVSGAGTGDAKQTTITAECTDYAPNPFYPGEIAVEDENGSIVKISGETGKVVSGD